MDNRPDKIISRTPPARAYNQDGVLLMIAIRSCVDMANLALKVLKIKGKPGNQKKNLVSGSPREHFGSGTCKRQ